MSKIIGNIQTQAIQGAINGKNTLQGKLALGEGVAQIYDTYNGEYEVTPATVEKTLATKNCLMQKDIVIKPIPKEYGLVTYNQDRVITIS